MPLVISPYISPYTPYLRTPLYYTTWTLYYLTYLISPGLLTILQLLCMLLEHLLPRVECWVESEMRGRLRSCQWAQEEWRKGGRGLRNIAREKWAKDARNTVGVGEATGWAMGGWNWVSGMFGGGAKKTLNPIVTSPRPHASPIRSSTHPLSTFPPSKPLSPRSTASSHPPFPSSASAFDRRGAGSSNPFRDGLRERQFRGVGGSGVDRRLPHHHGRSTSYAPNVDYDDDRGSVWSGSEWRAV
ncbi:hypothetical protein JCM5353_002104 [Sporobolomyces roseus]